MIAKQNKYLIWYTLPVGCKRLAANRFFELLCVVRIDISCSVVAVVVVAVGVVEFLAVAVAAVVVHLNVAIAVIHTVVLSNYLYLLVHYFDCWQIAEVMLKIAVSMQIIPLVKKILVFHFILIETQETYDENSFPNMFQIS